MNEFFRPDDTRDALRKIGGLLIGLAAVMIYIRKGPFLATNNRAVGGVPDVPGARDPRRLPLREHPHRPQTGELRPWQAVHNVFGLIFVPLALRAVRRRDRGHPDRLPERLLDLRRHRRRSPSTRAPRAGVRVQFLLGSIAVIVSWTALWDKILSGGIGAHWGIYRGLLGHPRDRAARGGPVCLAQQPRRRRRGRQRHGSRRGPRPLEGVGARHRRRDRGGDRLRPRASPRSAT